MDAQSLIECWELGRCRHPLDRALLLFAAAEPHQDVEALADRPIGARNAALLGLRQRLFGDVLKSCVACPACDEELEFQISARELLARAPVDPSAYIDFRGHRLRLPTTRDLASVADEADAAAASRLLLARIFESAEREPDTPELAEVADVLDAADPCMDLAFALSCASCAHEWSAPLDVPAFLWEEINARVRILLDDVHALARAYGWSEQQILALSDARRGAYLERIQA